MKIEFARPDREHEAAHDALEVAALRVLRAGRFILGEEVTRFEAHFASFLQAPFVRGVSNGTDALVVALHALGVGPGHDVVVGAYGFVAAPEAVVRVGARPVFADVDAATLGLSIASVRAVRTENTRALISVDLFGLAHDVEPLRRASGGAAIVEDAAQALGASFAGRPAGTMGDIGTFSFFPSKALGGAGDGGACVTADAALAERIARIRTHGSGSSFPWETRGGNYRLDALQAALLDVKLALLPARLERRRAIGQALVAAVRRGGGEPIVPLINDSNPSDPACDAACVPAFAPLAVRVGARDRTRWLDALRSSGIDARVHYPKTLPECPPFAAFCAAARDAYPEAARAAQELFSVPCHPEMLDDEVAYLVHRLERVAR